VKKSDLDQRFESRCPRQLDKLPDTWCPLGALRLKAIRTLGREPTEKEEAGLPGCKWAVSHQLSGYCWFKYESQYMPDSPPSDQEAAALLCLTPETIRKTSENAIEKIRKSKFVEDLKKQHGQDPVVEDSSEEDNSIYCE
jgi:hypothetical protein